MNNYVFIGYRSFDLNLVTGNERHENMRKQKHKYIVVPNIDYQKSSKNMNECLYLINANFCVGNAHLSKWIIVYI